MPIRIFPFSPTDIWMTGWDQTVLTGLEWPYLDYEYPGAGSLSFRVHAHPLAIQIGNSVSQVFGVQWGPRLFAGKYKQFLQYRQRHFDPVPETYFGDELSYLREVSRSANAYAQSVANASNAVTSQYSGYPSGNTLADHLKIVARLIKGGLRTRMYLVSLGSFDTHSNQVNTDNLTGTQPNF
jgi:hypothetical protein